MTFLGHINQREGHDYWREQWMKSMQEAAVATLEAHTTLAVDDGAANEPELHVVGFDPLANCWTGAVVPNLVKQLEAEVARLKAILALHAGPQVLAEEKPAIPARALNAKRQRIGLFLPEGF